MSKLTDADQLEIALSLMRCHDRELYQRFVERCEKRGKKLTELDVTDLAICLGWLRDELKEEIKEARDKLAF